MAIVSSSYVSGNGVDAIYAVTHLKAQFTTTLSLPLYINQTGV
jgi:hypothetical protein